MLRKVALVVLVLGGLVASEASARNSCCCGCCGKKNHAIELATQKTAPMSKCCDQPKPPKE